MCAFDTWSSFGVFHASVKFFKMVRFSLSFFVRALNVNKHWPRTRPRPARSRVDVSHRKSSKLHFHYSVYYNARFDLVDFFRRSTFVRFFFLYVLSLKTMLRFGTVCFFFLFNRFFCITPNESVAAKTHVQDAIFLRSHLDGCTDFGISIIQC